MEDHNRLTLIKALVRPDRIEDVVQALEEAGVCSMSVIDVQALGKGVDPTDSHYSVEFLERYSTLARLEVVCPHVRWQEAIELIKKAAHTGEPGDGVVYAADVHDVYDIRSGEPVTGSSPR